MNAESGPPPALVLDNLDVAYHVRGRDRQVLRGISFSIAAGESYGLVGESGCGKSTAALAAIRYLPRAGRIRGGTIRVGGRDVMAMGEGELRRLRAEEISMVYQDPLKALNPSITIGRQLAEIFEVAGIKGRESGDRALAMLKKVQISAPERVMDRYPHQLSGGMNQRVVIAMALARERRLIILDEPTTGLDATVEAEVLDLIESLRGEHNTSVLFIGHNLGVIARMCDRVGVLYAGALVEEGPTRDVFANPRHPYTVGLLRCIPRRGRGKYHARLDTIPGFLPAVGTRIEACVFADRCALADEKCRTVTPPFVSFGHQFSRCHYPDRAADLPRATEASLPNAPVPDAAATPVLRVRNLSKTFRAGGVPVHAVVDINLDIAPGETLGLVGESGSGKTSFARTLLGLTAPDAGSIIEIDGNAIGGLASIRGAQELKALQIVFQNPDSALNRAHTVRGLIGRSIGKLTGLIGKARIDRLLALTRSVRLADRLLANKPRQLSGGLKQRVAIARAFAGDPRLVVCDEPTSALDVSVQAAILNLLADLQASSRVSYIFVSHDLGVVRYLSDRIAVLYLGRLMELGAAETVFAGPHHPYTEALLSAVPTGEQGGRDRIRLKGEIPSPLHPPSGCVFHTRCPRYIGPICEQKEPAFAEREGGHFLRCHLPDDQLGSEASMARVPDGPLLPVG